MKRLGPEKQEERGKLRAQDSRVSIRGVRRGMVKRTKVGPLLYPHFCPSSSPNIQTLYSRFRGWEVVSLITGEQEP